MSAVHNVRSEAAYDLMQDHIETLLLLLEAPRSRDEVLQQLGDEVALTRLERHGLISCDGTTVSAVAETYSQVRQEGMMTFLDRYVLPGLSAAGSDATLAVMHLAGRAIDVRDNHVVPLLQALGEVSHAPAEGPVSRLSVIVVGTSRPVDADAEPETAALHVLKQAGLQRSTPAEREDAFMVQVDLLADAGRYRGAQRALDVMLASLRDISAPQSPQPPAQTLHLAAATHWAGPSQLEQELQQDLEQTRTAC